MTVSTSARCLTSSPAYFRGRRVYAMDAASGEPRELAPHELEGAVAKRSATLLELKGGRTAGHAGTAGAREAPQCFIARHAPHGRVANLAMQLMSGFHESRDYEDLPGGYRMALARLRAALEEAATKPA